MQQIPIVFGKPFTDIPNDLFIPPDALEVLLDSFTGPLDLLLYLIRSQNLDIMDIPMTLITQQYMQYIDCMQEKRMELASDYLVMAAVLIEIKSRLLLPVVIIDDSEPEADPRMELVKRLQLYEQFKQKALELDCLPRRDRDIFPVQCTFQGEIPVIKPDVTLDALILAMQQLLMREKQLSHHRIFREPLSVRDRMTKVLQFLQTNNLLELTQLFTQDEGRAGLVVSLLAVLELAKQAIIVITQTQAFAMIYLQIAKEET